VGKYGAAFGVANNTRLNVYELLVAVNNSAKSGVLYGGNAKLQAQCADLLAALTRRGARHTLTGGQALEGSGGPVPPIQTAHGGR
jgi:hypothetical protein